VDDLLEAIGLRVRRVQDLGEDSLFFAECGLLLVDDNLGADHLSEVIDQAVGMAAAALADRSHLPPPPHNARIDV
jgi:hypothetical protein